MQLAVVQQSVTATAFAFSRLQQKMQPSKPQGHTMPTIWFFFTQRRFTGRVTASSIKNNNYCIFSIISLKSSIDLLTKFILGSPFIYFLLSPCVRVSIHGCPCVCGRVLPLFLFILLHPGYYPVYFKFVII